MKVRSIFIFTHDSIGVGEDGPTHQPIEHVMALRIIPDLKVFRPADANETGEVYRLAVKADYPSAIILSRQNLPVLTIDKYPVTSGVKRGGYVVSDCDGRPELILIGTGSEVHLLLEVQKQLNQEGRKVRVVSLPCWELFREQDIQYQNSVLPPNIKKRISLEAGVTTGWKEWTGEVGINLGINQFGESGPGEQVFEKFGFTVEKIKEIAIRILS